MSHAKRGCGQASGIAHSLDPPFIPEPWLEAPLATILLVVLTGCNSPSASPVQSDNSRLISLSPAITETLFKIGAGSQIQGVSDYCDDPTEATRLPRTGTALNPNYEAITRLNPSLILTELNASAKTDNLQKLAPTRPLPWLSVNDVITSTHTLGELTGHLSEANDLAQRLRSRLVVNIPVHGPRVLVTVGFDLDQMSPLYFIRRNSLHGAALHAAGARNAINEDVSGVPTLSIQRLVEIDPDIIFVLMPHVVTESERNQILERWRTITPLTAVRLDRVSVLGVPYAHTTGPRILDLADQLADELRKIADK